MECARNESFDKINHIEIMRAQIEDLRKANASNKQLDQALEALYKKMYETELHYLSRTEMHSDDKWYVEKYKLYLNLVWLLGEVGDRKSTRLNSSHLVISYAVFCLKKTTAAGVS